MLDLSKLKVNNLNQNIINNDGKLNNNITYNHSSTKVWFNSVYNYFKNNEKNIPSIDVLVYKIIKNYFNMYSSRLEKSIFLRKKSLKRRRYMLKKILVSKPEFKHTNDKVKITLYIYNTELSFLNVRLRNLKKKILAQYFYKIFTTKYITLNKLILLKSFNKRIFLLKSYIKDLKKSRSILLEKYYIKDNSILLASNTIKNYYQEWSNLKFISSFLKSNRLLRINYILNRFEKNARKTKNFLKKNLYNKLSNRLEKKNFLKKRIQVKFLSKSLRIVKYLSVLFNTLNNKIYKTTIDYYNEQVKNMPIFSISKKIFVKKIKKMVYRLRLYLKYNRIITFNKLKFNNFLVPLKLYLEKIYKKDVEFNIVTVKNYRLNSSILTQVLAIKLRNKKISPDRVMQKILSKLKFPISKKLDYIKKIPINKFRQNVTLIENLNQNFVYSIPKPSLGILNEALENKKAKVTTKNLCYGVYKGDKLDLLLKNIYPNQKTIINNNLYNVVKYVDNDKSLNILLERNLENVVLDSIKNKFITGMRIETSGRLSKRAVAAKSYHKMRQKGTIKDINSSYKKLSSLLLRGNIKSNLQFTKLTDKSRIGSFGLKGWISSI